MNIVCYVFSQLITLISYKQFKILVNRLKGYDKVKEYTSWKQFLCKAFGQLTHRESPSDTMICLKAFQDKTNHLGIGTVVS